MPYGFRISGKDGDMVTENVMRSTDGSSAQKTEDVSPEIGRCNFKLIFRLLRDCEDTYLPRNQVAPYPVLSVVLLSLQRLWQSFGERYCVSLEILTA